MTFTERFFIPLVVSIALFMEALDTNIINTAIPAMSYSLRVHPIDLKIALVSYLLSLAVFIPISGWLAEKFGSKRVFMIAIVCFVISSILCGFAQHLFSLVIARVMQGFGGSLMIPVGRLILLRTFKRHEYIDIMNRVVIVIALGLMLGPVLGGIITQYLSWHWIFWVNIPIGLLNFLLAYYWLPASPGSKVNPLDKVGFILFGCGLATFTYALSAFSETNVPMTYTVVLLLVSILMLVGYFWHSRGRKHPILKTSLFKIRTFRISILSNFLSRLGFGGVPFLLPLLLQLGLDYSAKSAGLLLAPMAIGILSNRPFALGLLRTFGYKKVLIINTILVALSMWSFAFIYTNTSYLYIAFVTFLYGFLISLQYGSINSLAYAEVTADDLSNVTSIVSTVQQLTQSFGVATAAIMLRYNSIGTKVLTPEVFHKTFYIMGALTLVSIFVFTDLKRNDGKEMLKKTTSNKDSEVIP